MNRWRKLKDGRREAAVEGERIREARQNCRDAKETGRKKGKEGQKMSG